MPLFRIIIYWYARLVAIPVGTVNIQWLDGRKIFKLQG